MKRTITVILSLLALLSCTSQQPQERNIAQLAEEFVTPPLSSRPGVYWYFMDGNMSREGMTKDLESMKEIGIGYVIFLEVNCGVPRGDVDFMSEEWISLFKHAVSECERLDIQMVLGIGPGWTGSGGPWVKGELSMQHLMASTTCVQGGSKVEAKLEVPRPNPPFFGEGNFTEQMKKDWDEFYNDVVVLAFPTPEGDERLSDIQEKALFIRPPFSSQPGVRQYIPCTADIGDLADASSVDPASVIDISDKMDAEGNLVWDAPAGKWTILRLGSRNNGAVTRPAPLPGVGMECDKFSREALYDHFSHFTDRLFEAVGKPSKTFGGIKYLHIDSWEPGAQNWTPRFREEFMKRRGYDPQPYFPVYSGIIVGDRKKAERFLFDVRLTSQELIIENHSTAVKEYAHERGLLLSIEPYDMNPSSDLELAVSADVPMAEFWSRGYGFHTAFAAAEGSSAAHLIGSPVVPAEAFTSHLDGWKQSPGSIKNQVDWAYGAGINRLMFHTFQHQCLPDTLRPGMTMGPYGIHWDRNQTWWTLSKAFHEYVGRCQNMLQQGRTVADILYLVPEGAPHVFKAPDSAYDNEENLMPDRKAYNFDGCPPSMLAKASVKDGRVVFPSGASYAVMVLPVWKTATPEWLEQVYRLVKAGATIVGVPPVESPSLVDYPSCDAKVTRLAAGIWGNSGEKVRKVGKGTVILFEGEPDKLYQPYPQTAELLGSMGVAPDMVAESGVIRYHHRTTADAEIYFLANRTDEASTTACHFRVTGKVPELWDPVTGKMTALPDYVDDGVCTTMTLAFEQTQSFFIVFTDGGSGAPAASENFHAAEEVMTVDTPWNVTFDSEWGTDETVVLEHLVDLTTMSDPLVKYYSGTMFYETAFELQGEAPSEGVIDLGDVGVIAKVWVNGAEVGTAWSAPWKVSAAGNLRQGTNTIKVEVANLWQNRLIGDADGAPCKRHTFTTWTHCHAGDSLLKSGLVGPVRILR